MTDIKIRALKPTPGKTLTKHGDRDGLYVAVLASGVRSFRFDYIFRGRGQTLTFGRYPDVTLAAARAKLADARKLLADGENPADHKRRRRGREDGAQTFGALAEIWLRDAGLAPSTVTLRKRILDGDILPAFGKRQLTDISTPQVMDLCEKILARGAPSTAVHAREIISLVYRWAAARGIEVGDPAGKIKGAALATFKPRERALTPGEIGTFFNVLEGVGSQPALKLAFRLVLLTLVRKGEMIGATFDEFDLDAATWTIPAGRMKGGRTHVIYLSRQVVEIVRVLKGIAGRSAYLLQARGAPDKPICTSTLNSVINVVIRAAKKTDVSLEPFALHDMRRTASTLLHDAGFSSDVIEKALAHQQRGIRAVYNRAEYAEQRRDMLQKWADMVDEYCAATAPA
ncbi:tyrosine-type recombinase/integrase [Paraburkholderia domus]|uniref:tyrosine-type recombinase/integrase n=1 Tax=Paraburkholderia domus TaxID=2793075 RepID=UPI001B8B4BB4|nr:site-specific integrase [Paraburkholderia domus]